MWQQAFKKAITFSFDDGVEQDIRLVELLNKYHLKATFNINTGLAKSQYAFTLQDHLIKRLPLETLKELYQGHEVAVHTYSHPFLADLSDEEVLSEIQKDIFLLEKTFNVKPLGMAYPYGSYDDRIVDIIKKSGLTYARIIEPSNDTKPSSDLFRLKPTCHLLDEHVHQIIDHFLQSNSDEPQILYLWGHSYEGDIEHKWEVIEDIFKKLSNHKNIFYGTNQEVLLS